MNAAIAAAKALTGAVVAALGALGAALEDGHVSQQEWVTIALAFFVALSAVYAVPNLGQSPEHDDVDAVDEDVLAAAAEHDG